MSSRRVKIAGTRRGPRRARRRGPVLIGLTGSIAMGKSTTANFLKSLGVLVFDADASVHVFMGPKGKALAALKQRFPGVVGAQGVDRKALGALVFADRQALRDLEAIIHPLVREDRERFLKNARLRRHPVVALDIPLLFEGKNHSAFDLVVVVSAPAFLQRQRALARPAMTPRRLEGILAQQWPDARKRAHADIIIPSGLGKRETLRRLKQFLKVRKLKTRRKGS